MHSTEAWKLPVSANYNYLSVFYSFPLLYYLCLGITKKPSLVQSQILKINILSRCEQNKFIVLLT